MSTMQMYKTVMTIAAFHNLIDEKLRLYHEFCVQRRLAETQQKETRMQWLFTGLCVIICVLVAVLVLFISAKADLGGAEGSLGLGPPAVQQRAYLQAGKESTPRSSRFC